MSNVLSKMVCDPPSASYKHLADAKHNIVKLHCECMLCKKNGVERPTLFCEWADCWKSQFFPCCCVIDLNHECEQVVKRHGVSGELAKVQCVCPRCCKSCFNKSERKNLKCNGWCHLRLKVFIPCVHFKGYCH